MKAADISDEAFIDAVRTVQRLRPGTATRWDVGFVLEGREDVVATYAQCDGLPGIDYPRLPDPVIPEKVVLAKARKLIKRGLVDGCYCGCRGDFKIPDGSDLPRDGQSD